MILLKPPIDQSCSLDRCEKTDSRHDFVTMSWETQNLLTQVIIDKLIHSLPLGFIKIVA